MNHVFHPWNILRISRPEVLCKKGVLRNFAKLTGNTCASVSFFNFTKKETLAQVFSCEFCEISSTFLKILTCVSVITLHRCFLSHEAKIIYIFRIFNDGEECIWHKSSHIQLLNIKEIADWRKQEKYYLSWFYASTLNHSNHLKH